MDHSWDTVRGGSSRKKHAATDEERDAIEGNVLTFQKLRAKPWDATTPCGRTPRELESREEPIVPTCSWLPMAADVVSPWSTG